MTEREKLEYLSRNFGLLNREGKDYLRNVSRQLLYVQYPIVPPSAGKKRRYTRPVKGAEV
jgi:hypothetical protein